MNKQFKARSPAKLILSGEHAVVYGKPAIAMAINRYAESTINANLSSAILFNCLNFKSAKSFTLQALEGIKHRLQDKYHAFLDGRCGIREVLKTPFELLQYTVTHLLETLNVTLSDGLEIRAASEIPIGCGMGSSAAIVMSTLYALAHFLKLEIDPARFLALGREAENLQHGYSSGLDLHLAMKGGCLRFEEGQTLVRTLPNVPLSIAQTGTPESTTGQCVSQVSKHFKRSSIADDFAAITELFDKAKPLSNKIIEFKRDFLEALEPLIQMKVSLGKAAADQEQYTFNSKNRQIRGVIRYNKTTRYDDGVQAAISYAKEWLQEQVEGEKEKRLVVHRL